MSSLKVNKMKLDEAAKKVRNDTRDKNAFFKEHAQAIDTVKARFSVDSSIESILDVVADSGMTSNKYYKRIFGQDLRIWLECFGSKKLEHNVSVILDYCQRKSIRLERLFFFSLLADVGCKLSFETFKRLVQIEEQGTSFFYSPLVNYAVKDDAQRFDFLFEQLKKRPHKSVVQRCEYVIDSLVSDKEVSHIAYIIKLLECAPNVVSRKKKFFGWLTHPKGAFTTPSLTDLVAYLDIQDERKKLDGVLAPIKEKPKKRISPF